MRSFLRLSWLHATTYYYLAGFVVAQNDPSPTLTSSAAIETHTISVGIDHKFKPEVTQAEVGDLIQFEFFPPNHSVVRAEYEYPCIPYEMTGRGKKGFFSGFRPVDAILDEPPTFTVRINDTDPIFLYCSAPGSCITYGMVAVINPNANTSLENQRQLAKDSSYMLNPGEPFPPEEEPPSFTTGSGSPATTSSSESEKTTSDAAGGQKSHTSLSAGAIAGIVIAGVAILGLAAALFFYIGRLRSVKQEINRASVGTMQSPPMYKQHSLYAPHSDIDGHSRHSGVPGQYNPHYSNAGMEGYGRGSLSPDAGFSQFGEGYPGMASPPLQTPVVMAPTPEPRELDAPDSRYSKQA